MCTMIYVFGSNEPTNAYATMQQCRHDRVGLGRAGHTHTEKERVAEKKN